MLKPVLALPGQTAYRDRLTITVDEIEVGEAPTAAGLAGPPRHRRLRGLPHELAIGGFSRRAAFRHTSDNRDYPAGRTSLDERRGLVVPPNRNHSAIPLFDR